MCECTNCVKHIHLLCIYLNCIHFICGRGFLEAKAREQELAMWKRRATYDPMKAAAEGRKKQEEAKKTTQKTIRFNDR